MSRNLSFSLSVLVAGAGALVVLGATAPAPAEAQKGKVKVARACGITAIPLTVGNTWTYEPTQYPPATGDNAVREEAGRLGAQKLFPLQPVKVVITVTAVEAKDTTAKITLSEQITHKLGEKGEFTEELTTETSVTCTANSMTVSPDSFWFAGEPGGGADLSLDKLERKGHTLPISDGKFSGSEWHDDVKLSWKREATKDSQADLGSGTMSIERRMVLVANEPIGTTAGSYQSSAKIGIETSGEIAIDGSGSKGSLLPEGLVSYLWFVDGVGLVMVNNTFFHAYQLTAVTIAK